jgi:mRNA-degrading endonuclease RelE of RelBE toxin-antitoxin system
VRIEFKSSFDRHFKKLPADRQQRVVGAINELLLYLDGAGELRKGLGLKNWHKNYWEIRAGLRDRIIFELTDRLIFRMVGNHEEIRRFMDRR